MVPKTRMHFVSMKCVVGEHSLCHEVRPVRADGVQGRENVGTSNHKSCENQDLRKSKVSSATMIVGG